MEKIAENDKAIFYKNSFCEDFGDGYKIIIAERKDDLSKEYILLKDGNPVYSNKDIESLWVRHDVLKRVNS